MKIVPCYGDFQAICIFECWDAGAAMLYGYHFGHRTDQKLHGLPYRKFYTLLQYKLALCGIRMVKQKKAYSSQTSPLKESVCRKNRMERGLYTDGTYSWNADCVRAFNILRLYFQSVQSRVCLDPSGIQVPYVVKVAV